MDDSILITKTNNGFWGIDILLDMAKQQFLGK